MLIPLQILQAAKLGNEQPISRFGCGVLFERDADGVPWFIITDGKALLCLTWTEPKLEGMAKQRLFPPNLDPRNGSQSWLARSDALWVALAHKKRMLTGFGPDGYDHWAALSERNDTLLLSALSATREAVVSIAASADYRQRFPDHRSILDGWKARLDYGKRELSGKVWPQVLANGTLLPLMTALDELDLNYVEIHATEQPEQASLPILFHALTDGSDFGLNAVGAVMPLERSAIPEIRWPAALRETPQPQQEAAP